MPNWPGIPTGEQVNFQKQVRKWSCYIETRVSEKKCQFGASGIGL